MRLALSREEESQRTVHRGNVKQRPSPACRRGLSGGSNNGTGASGAPRRCYPVGHYRSLQKKPMKECGSAYPMAR
jgi:hypothetical protein